MEEKIPRHYLYIVVLLLLAVGAILVWNYAAGKKSEPGGVAGVLEGRNSELEERERQIQALDEQVAQLRKELDASSRKAAELQDRLDDTRRALSSTEQKLRSAVRQAERSGPPAARRPAEPGAYEVVRSTSVFAEPSEASRKVSAVKRGTRVTVVGSSGEWLEVRSKHGNPPGFIRRDDAMFLERTE
ncbi:MAG: hypothetical protein HYY83_04705 [Deltaproteobacteria bacterium]|nr:hypothetical protein [Deltaproteobacteria bacterium]